MKGWKMVGVMVMMISIPICIGVHTCLAVLRYRRIVVVAVKKRMMRCIIMSAVVITTIISRRGVVLL